jgi:hypothetical protein
MKKKSTQQEILLVTGTGFSTRQWCKNDENGKQENLTDLEKLEEACWNGLIQELLPEIYNAGGGEEKMYLWYVRKISSFLELELGNFPDKIDYHYSINPYSFIMSKSRN